jgi:hypothetical protein
MVRDSLRAIAMKPRFADGDRDDTASRKSDRDDTANRKSDRDDAAIR